MLESPKKIIKNRDIKGLIAKEGLYHYEVAAAMGVKPNTLAQYLRSDLTKNQKERIKEAVSIAKNGVKAHGETKQV